MSQNLVGDELLVAVFHSFPKDESLKFKDEANIMLAFYKASKEPIFEEFFKNYQFDEDGIMPYSKEIADGINILHQSSLLGKWNPSFSFYKLSKGIDYRYSKIIAPKITEEKEGLLSKLSEVIKGQLLPI